MTKNERIAATNAAAAAGNLCGARVRIVSDNVEGIVQTYYVEGDPKRAEGAVLVNDIDVMTFALDARGSRVQILDVGPEDIAIL